MSDEWVNFRGVGFQPWEIKHVIQFAGEGNGCKEQDRLDFKGRKQMDQEEMLMGI